MAVKKRHDDINEDSVFDASHEYRCTCCGNTYSNPNGIFYKNNQSESFKSNSGYTNICRKCVDKMLEEYIKKFDLKTATIIICAKLDFPFYFSLFKSVNEKNEHFTIGKYTKNINGLQYVGQTFGTTIASGELRKSEADVEIEKEARQWTKQEEKNKNFIIDVLEYDPFEGYNADDRRYLFSRLMPWFEDENNIEDKYKLGQIIQIVTNEKQIKDYDMLISNLNPKMDAKVISEISDIKSKLVTNNTKIAKENGISVNNRADKSLGKSTLTYLMRDLREKNFEKAEVDYYDQLKSEGSRWANDMSIESIIKHGMFDETAKNEIYAENLKLIDNLYHDLDDEKEKVRLLNKKIDEMNKQISELQSRCK